MNINIKKAGYESFGRCLHITNSKLELVVALESGIRVLHSALQEAAMYSVLRTMLKYRVSGWIFRIRRVWAAPEELPKTYYPDDNPVAYESTAIR